MSNGAVALDYEWDKVKYGFYLSKKKCIQEESIFLLETEESRHPSLNKESTQSLLRWAMHQCQRCHNLLLNTKEQARNDPSLVSKTKRNSRPCLHAVPITIYGGDAVPITIYGCCFGYWRGIPPWAQRVISSL